MWFMYLTVLTSVLAALTPHVMMILRRVPGQGVFNAERRRQTNGVVTEQDLRAARSQLRCQSMYGYNILL